MEPPMHTMSALFEQLGLDGDTQAIQNFVDRHRGLCAAVALYDAPIWSASQSSFLREALSDDADWSEVVDQLDALLR